MTTIRRSDTAALPTPTQPAGSAPIESGNAPAPASSTWGVGASKEVAGNEAAEAFAGTAGQSAHQAEALRGGAQTHVASSGDLYGVTETPNPPAPEGTGALKQLGANDAFKKRIALTFDDGPHRAYTPKVLDILKAHGVKATFFVCGNNVRQNPELVRRIVAEGHTLGNHSWDHANLAKLSPAAIHKELADTQAAVDQALGYHYELKQVRPPYGSWNGAVKNEIASHDQVGVIWNVDSLDWKYPKSPNAILQNIFGGSSSVYARGGVVLFHDVHPQGPALLDGVITRLQNEGFKLEKTDQFINEKYFTPNVPNS